MWLIYQSERVYRVLTYDWLTEMRGLFTMYLPMIDLPKWEGLPCAYLWLTYHSESVYHVLTYDWLTKVSVYRVLTNDWLTKVRVFTVYLPMIDLPKWECLPCTYLWLTYQSESIYRVLTYDWLTKVMSLTE
jgi:hypothetical protein